VTAATRSRKWQDKRLSEGWIHIQLWGRPHVADAVRALCDRARVAAPDVTEKEVIEDALLQAARADGYLSRSSL